MKLRTERRTASGLCTFVLAGERFAAIALKFASKTVRQPQGWVERPV